MARWIGVALSLVGIIATLWLAATGQLELYIHPRYTLFTVIMATIGGALVIAALIVVPGGAARADAATAPALDHAAHDHDHGHADDGLEGLDPERPVRTRIVTVSRVLITLVAALALLVVPPATLSATTLQNRDLASSGQALESTDAAALVGADSTSFSLKDWAALLRQGGPDAVLGQRVDVSGYLLDRGDDDVVYVVRMMVTCCAVDGQPVGVPVYAPGWRDEYGESAWVQLDGRFAENPDVTGEVPSVVLPDEMTVIDEPDQPYVF